MGWQVIFVGKIFQANRTLDYLNERLESFQG